MDHKKKMRESTGSYMHGSSDASQGRMDSYFQSQEVLQSFSAKPEKAIDNNSITKSFKIPRKQPASTEGNAKADRPYGEEHRDVFERRDNDFPIRNSYSNNRERGGRRNFGRRGGREERNKGRFEDRPGKDSNFSSSFDRNAKKRGWNDNFVEDPKRLRFDQKQNKDDESGRLDWTGSHGGESSRKIFERRNDQRPHNEAESSRVQCQQEKRAELNTINHSWNPRSKGTRDSFKDQEKGNHFASERDSFRNRRADETGGNNDWSDDWDEADHSFDRRINSEDRKNSDWSEEDESKGNRIKEEHRDELQLTREDHEGSHDRFSSPSREVLLNPKDPKRDFSRFKVMGKPYVVHIMDSSVAKKKKISHENATTIMKIFEEIIRDTVINQPETEEPLKFMGMQYQRGWVCVFSCNLFSCEFVKQKVETMEAPWPGATLEASISLSGYGETFVGLTLPNSMGHLSELIRLCKKTNRNMHTDTWRRIECDSTSNCERKFEMGIDKLSMPAIGRSNQTLQCEELTVKLHCFPKKHFGGLSLLKYF